MNLLVAKQWTYGLLEAYSWYEPKPFWYLYFSKLRNCVTVILKVFGKRFILIQNGFVA